MPAQRIEIQPRRHRDPCPFQNVRRQHAAVIGQIRHIGIDVKRTIRRRDLREPRLGQPVQHQRAVGAVDVHVGLQLVLAIHRRQRRDLCRMGRADEHVLRQPFDHTHVIGRHHHPANAPAGHREVFRERVDHIGLVRHLKCRHSLGLVFDAVINLVADERRALGVGGVDQRAHRPLIQHRPRRVRGRGDHQPRDVHIGKIRRHRLIAVFGRCGQIDRLQVQRPQDLAVAGIARRTNRHAVAGVEQRGERQDKAPGRSGCDHHARRVQIDVVPVTIHLRDARPQRWQPQGHGIAQRPVIHGPRQRIGCRTRRTGAGLADLHVDDVTARIFGSPRGLHHVHHDKGINGAAS